MSKADRIRCPRYPGVYYRESTRRTYKGKPDRRYWVCFTNQAGKLVWEKIGWASKGRTERFAANERQRLIDEDAQATPTAIPTSKFTVGHAVAGYEKWATAEGKHIGREMNRYDKHLKSPLDALPLRAVNPQMLTDLKAGLLENLAPQTVLHAFSFLRRAVNLAITDKAYSGPNPFATSRTSSFRLPRPDNASVRFFTPDEAHRLLSALACQSLQVYDMSHVSLKTGLRATELFSLTGQDVGPGSDVIHFRGKGGRREHVHAPEEIVDLLLSYGRAPGEHIFQSRSGGPITSGISAVFSRAVADLGLNKGVTDSRHKVRFHTWRHTFASWLAQSGKVTLQELQALMRHERIDMTLRYAHLTGSQKEKLSIIGRTFDAARNSSISGN